MTGEKLGLIGRDDYLVKNLAEKVQSAASKCGDYTSLRQIDNRRGYSFEVLLRLAAERTGHIVRVTVELDRVEAT